MVKKSRLAADIIYEAYQEGLRQAALDAYTRKKKRDLRAIQAVTRSLRAPQTSAMMAKYAQLAARQLAEKELSQPRPMHRVLRVVRTVVGFDHGKNEWIYGKDTAGGGVSGGING